MASINPNDPVTHELFTPAQIETLKLPGRTHFRDEFEPLEDDNRDGGEDEDRTRSDSCT